MTEKEAAKAHYENLGDFEQLMRNDLVRSKDIREQWWRNYYQDSQFPAVANPTQIPAQTGPAWTEELWSDSHTYDQIHEKMKGIQFGTTLALQYEGLSRKLLSEACTAYHWLWRQEHIGITPFFTPFPFTRQAVAAEQSAPTSTTTPYTPDYATVRGGHWEHCDYYKSAHPQWYSYLQNGLNTTAFNVPSNQRPKFQHRGPFGTRVGDKSSKIYATYDSVQMEYLEKCALPTAKILYTTTCLVQAQNRPAEAMAWALETCRFALTVAEMWSHHRVVNTVLYNELQQCKIIYQQCKGGSV